MTTESLLLLPLPLPLPLLLLYTGMKCYFGPLDNEYSCANCCWLVQIEPAAAAAGDEAAAEVSADAAAAAEESADAAAAAAELFSAVYGMYQSLPMHTILQEMPQNITNAGFGCELLPLTIHGKKQKCASGGWASKKSTGSAFCRSRSLHMEASNMLYNK